MMRPKAIVGIALAAAFASCASFSEMANLTQIAQTDDGYTKVYNEKAQLASLTFGDFKFATNRKAFRELNPDRPAFKNILFYAKTSDVPYEYYVLHAPESDMKNPNFQYTDTVIGNIRFVLAVSKSAPKADAVFIRDGLRALRD